MSVQFTTTIQHDITADMLRGLFITAFEGGSNYWLHAAVLKESANKPAEEPWYSDEPLFEASFKIELTYDNPDEGPDVISKIISEEDVQRGLDDLGRLYPFRARNIVEDNIDAEDADVFLQVVLFEKIIFG